MNAWLNRFPVSLPERLTSPEETAALELRSALPELAVSLEKKEEMGEGFCLRRVGDRIRLLGGETGLLYGAWFLM